MCKDLDQGLQALNLLFFGIIDFILVLYPFLASREGKNVSIGGGSKSTTVNDDMKMKN